MAMHVLNSNRLRMLAKEKEESRSCSEVNLVSRVRVTLVQRNGQRVTGTLIDLPSS